jgi:ariadne-1
MPVQGSFTGECDHRLCSECFTSTIRTHVTEGNVAEAAICCVDCRRPFTAVAVEQTLRANGESDLADSFLALKTEEGLTADTANFRRCPHTGCNHLFAWSTGDRKDYECPECSNAFCLECTAGGDGSTAAVGPAHPGLSCRERREQLERDVAERGRFEEWRTLNSQADALFQQYVERDQDTRACPGCSRVINRQSACDHMTCRWCHAEFCIVCGRQPQCGVTCPHRR